MRVVAWAVGGLAALVTQVVLWTWAYKAYTYPCDDVGLGARPFCLKHYSPLAAVPLWVVTVVWFAVDLAILVLALWLAARQSAGKDRLRRILWRGTAVAAGIVAVQAVFGYWYVAAYLYAPKYPCDAFTGRDFVTGCHRVTRAYHAALRQQNALQRVGSPTVAAMWLGVDMVLLGAGLWLYDTRKSAYAIAPPWWKVSP